MAVSLFGHGQQSLEQLCPVWEKAYPALDEFLGSHTRLVQFAEYRPLWQGDAARPRLPMSMKCDGSTTVPRPRRLMREKIVDSMLSCDFLRAIM